MDAEVDPPDPAASGGEQAAELRRAMAALSPEQRAAIALFYVEGFSVGEIAEASGHSGGHREDPPVPCAARLAPPT